MKRCGWGRILLVGLFLILLGACSGERKVNIKEITASPKVYIGSEKCKMCHLEHYDSWKGTLHSRMLQDTRQNVDAFVTEINPEVIRADLEKIAKDLKMPPDKFFIPKVEEIRYTIGNQWKQRYLVEKGGMLYIAPIQYNIDTGRWVNYNEDKWDKKPWIKDCGGCHATGVDLKKNSFSEPGTGCEACHGAGSHHYALPKTAVFEKRMTIVNPSKLPSGTSVQICGSCHNRGKSTKDKTVEWPVGYQPGKALETYFRSTAFGAGDTKHLYANEFSKGHHQQYIDWRQSKHHLEGVTCTSCHYVHKLGVPATRSQTKEAGSKECLSCHSVINNNLAHSIHSFANCVGCHMPRIVTSAESGDLHSHVFVTLLPKDTLKNPKLPNSCQTCHKHKDADLASLQKQFEAMSQLPKPQGKVIENIEKYKPVK
jgi:hypothetical protein